MKTQKQLKELKKQISKNSAFYQGVHLDIIPKLPLYALTEAIREISTAGMIKLDTEDAEINNMLITEAVKACNFQDFKEVSPFFYYSE